jgi:hypothetical protein
VSHHHGWWQQQGFFMLMHTNVGAAEKAQGFAQVSKARMEADATTKATFLCKKVICKWMKSN